MPDGWCRRTCLSSILHPAPFEIFMYTCIWQWLGIFLLSVTCALFFSRWDVYTSRKISDTVYGAKLSLVLWRVAVCNPKLFGVATGSVSTWTLGFSMWLLESRAVLVFYVICFTIYRYIRISVCFEVGLYICINLNLHIFTYMSTTSEVLILSFHLGFQSDYN